MGKHEAPDEQPTVVTAPPPHRLPASVAAAGAATVLVAVGFLAWMIAPDGDLAGTGYVAPSAIVAEPTHRGGPLSPLLPTAPTSTAWDPGKAPGDAAVPTRACRCAPREAITSSTWPTTASTSTSSSSSTSTSASTATTPSTATSTIASPTPAACELDPLIDCDGNPRAVLTDQPTATSEPATTEEIP